MTAGGHNPDAFEDLINGYALCENGGLDRSALLLQTLHKTRQSARVLHDFKWAGLCHLQEIVQRRSWGENHPEPYRRAAKIA
ncbi:hypothetical protein ELI03_27635 (plasmid) [Rhizobium leguminosarum]|uniref:Uncharacterized protein n=1 Tax=Rhizobium leguminosarum TaxID=384 RepID=A0A4Q8XU64_RHILE|nr:hypothetical protein ELI03_27635 [Rhizobium leguminosarum]